MREPQLRRFKEAQGAFGAMQKRVDKEVVKKNMYKEYKRLITYYRKAYELIQ